MAQTQITTTQLSCDRCGHTWIPRRGELPAVCPRCKRLDWNTPEKEAPAAKPHAERKIPKDIEPKLVSSKTCQTCKVSGKRTLRVGGSLIDLNCEACGGDGSFQVNENKPNKV